MAKQKLELAYNEQAIKQLCEAGRFNHNDISKAFKSTSTVTARRWIDGEDIYVKSFVRLCNYFKLDLLSMFTVNNERIKTNIYDLITFERAGMNLRDVMTEYGIKTCSQSDCLTLSNIPLVNDDPEDEDVNEDGNQKDEGTAKQPILSPHLPVEVLDRFVQIQIEFNNHEREALQNQRDQMNAIIKEKDATIALLKRELNLARKQLPVNSVISMVTEEDNLGEK